VRIRYRPGRGLKIYGVNSHNKRKLPERRKNKMTRDLSFWNSNVGLDILPISNAGLPKYIHCAIRIEAQAFLNPLQLRDNAASCKGAKKGNKKFLLSYCIAF
jgi:hypothetical protein